MTKRPVQAISERCIKSTTLRSYSYILLTKLDRPNIIKKTKRMSAEYLFLANAKSPSITASEARNTARLYDIMSQKGL
ncbi:hypothetical protein WAI453_011681 [Rhynchosporium graminicola]